MSELTDWQTILEFAKEIRELKDERNALLNQLADIRDLFETPKVKGQHEVAWLASVASPEGVYEYVKANVESLMLKNTKLLEYVQGEADHHCLEDTECGVCRSCKARLLLENKYD